MIAIVSISGTGGVRSLLGGRELSGFRVPTCPWLLRGEPAVGVGVGRGRSGQSDRWRSVVCEVTFSAQPALLTPSAVLVCSANGTGHLLCMGHSPGGQGKGDREFPESP